jgi:hypothetical protein
LIVIAGREESAEKGRSAPIGRASRRRVAGIASLWSDRVFVEGRITITNMIMIQMKMADECLASSMQADDMDESVSNKIEGF